MSIILKGIDMPKDCTECPLEGAEVDDDGFDYWYCKITESMATTIERPSNCPLIQIPKDHGRIVELKDIRYCALSSDGKSRELEFLLATQVEALPTILDEEGK